MRCMHSLMDPARRYWWTQAYGRKTPVSLEVRLRRPGSGTRHHQRTGLGSFGPSKQGRLLHACGPRMQRPCRHSSALFDADGDLALHANDRVGGGSFEVFGAVPSQVELLGLSASRAGNITATSLRGRRAGTFWTRTSRLRHCVDLRHCGRAGCWGNGSQLDHHPWAGASGAGCSYIAYQERQHPVRTVCVAAAICASQ